MSVWLLWLVLVFLPHLHEASLALTLLLGIGSIVGTIIYLIASLEKDEATQEQIKKIRFIIPSFFVFMLMSISTPNEEKMMYIVGGYIVTNAEDVEKLPSNLTKSANKFLENYLQEEKFNEG